ncbi:MAG: hypothetical protein ACREVV_09745, partial [Steroidobacteraceae bacterium]
EELIAASVVVAHAPRWLDAEMTSAIPQAASKRKIPVALLWERWHEYRSFLVWDDTLANPGNARGDCCDPKDVPYVQLYRKCNAAGVLSKDAHIEKLGGHALSHEFVHRARDYARAITPVISIRLAGVIFPIAAAAALAESLRGLVQLWTRLPDTAKAVILLGALLALLHPASRKWLFELFQRAADILTVAMDVISNVISHMASLHAQSLTAVESNLALTMALTRRPGRLRSAPRIRVREHRRRAHVLSPVVKGAQITRE